LLWWFVGIVGIGMFLAGVFLVAGGRGPGYNFWEERLGGTFFGGMGLLCAWVAYSQYRTFRPSPLGRLVPGVKLTVDHDEVRRGGTVSVTLDRPRSADGLEVGLVCVERFDLRALAQTKAGPIVVRETNQATAYEQWRPADAAGGEALAFEIPSGAPYSYEGDCLSYAWRVSLRRPLKLRPDPRTDRPVWVSP
jgi:hypothetical protein